MLILFLIVLLIVGGFALGAVSGAPWVPAFKKDLESVLDDSRLKKGEVFIELGCGDGRLVVAAAKRGALSVGYEISAVLWLIAWLRCLPYKNAQVKLRDFWGVDLSGADVVLAFLVPRTVGRLEKKAVKEMKSGSRLVSYVFKLPTLKPKLTRHHWLVYYF